MADQKKERVTIYRIAQEAGVSPATVSRVLTGSQKVSDAKRHRVDELIRRYDFRPSAIARSLTGRETSVLGFIQPDISHPYFQSIFLSAERRAIELGYTLFLGNTLNDNMRHVTDMELHYIQLMQQKHVDGIFISGGRTQDVDVSPDYQERFRSSLASTPIITVGSHVQWIDCPSVMADERRGIELLVNYLVSLKHRRIGFLGGVRGIEPTDTRLSTFRSALLSHGLEYHDEWHIESGFLMEDGRAAMEGLLQLRDRPTAVVGFNDLIAIGAMYAAHRSGLDIPGDISIAGVDNIAFSRYVYPPLTTVDGCTAELAERAVSKMVQLLAGEEPPMHTVIDPQLVIRESCAPPS